MNTQTVLKTVAWNRGKLIGQKPPLKRRQVWGIRIRLQIAEKARDLALFNLALDSKLRGCDLLMLRLGDVQDAQEIRRRAKIIQKKTGKPVQFEISQQTRDAIRSWRDQAGLQLNDWLFPSRVAREKPLSGRQYNRLVDRWVSSIGLPSASYGTHSLRRTKASLIYKKSGNLRAVQLLLGHTKIDSTVRYLGVEVDDALRLAESVGL